MMLSFANNRPQQSEETQHRRRWKTLQEPSGGGPMFSGRCDVTRREVRRIREDTTRGFLEGHQSPSRKPLVLLTFS